MENLVLNMQEAQESAQNNATSALANALNGKRTAFHASLVRDAATFNDALNHNYNAFTESINAQRAAFENSLAEKQAAFDAAKARKLKQIQFVHDSNYKFHLIKLLEAKAAAITEAIGQARQGFSEVLNQEAEAFTAFREAERTAFDEARQALRDKFAEGEIDAEAQLNAEIQQNTESFDFKLDEFSNLLSTGLTDQRNQFKEVLHHEEAFTEEEYTYTEHAAPTQNYSPYSHSSKNQFLSDFHYYLSDQLKKLDAGIDGVAEWTQKEVDAAVEAYATAVGYSEQRLGDQRLMAQEALAQLADSLATEYAEAQDLELVAIKDKRAGLEEAIAGKAEELKKKIVYLKKQLHYKGAYEAHEDYKLTDAIEALVGEFDAAVAEVRAWFANNIETEIGESTARANAVGEAFTEAVGRLMEIQAALSAELAQAARDGAISMEEKFVTGTQERLDAFNYVIHALVNNVESWYQDKQKWIDGLSDEYYAADLRVKLDEKKEQAFAALNDRASAAQEVVDYRREELSARLGELVGQFDNSANNELQTLADSSAAEAAALAGDVQATASGFASAADFANNGINAFMDDLVRQWVWWLKQYYGYDGYADHHYAGYDDGHAHGDHFDGAHGHDGHHEEGYSGAAPGHDAAHDPAYDNHHDHYDPHDLHGYDEIEAFFKRDFVGDLPDAKAGLLAAVGGAAAELEAWFTTFEDNAEGTLETRRTELQDRLVAARQGIEEGLAAAEVEAKAYIVKQRDAFIADVAEKRAAVEAAIAQLKEAHYGHGDEKKLLHEIHTAKEAFATAVQDARAEFDLVLSTAREASEGRLAAAREQLEAELARKRADLDGAINTLRTNLADTAAAKRESLALMLGAAWEDLEEAIAEKEEAFNWAVKQKLEWINKVPYYGLRHKLLEAVKELQSNFSDAMDGLRQMFADAAEERRLAADAHIAQEQDDFEAFVAGVLDTCDANRAAQSGYLEEAIAERRAIFDELLAACRAAISQAIDGQIKTLKDFLQSQYGYQGHQPGPYHHRPEKHYFDEEYVDAVQEYITHVTNPLAQQAIAALDWLQGRKEALKAGLTALNQEIQGAQETRAAWEVQQFGESVDAAIQANGELAAQLLTDVQAKNDEIQNTLDTIKHNHWGYQDAYGYRYKLMKQLHHQRIAFEQAVESAWTTWTQSRDLTLDTAAANAAAAAEAFEGFLATKLGEWEAAAAAARADLAERIAAKGEAIKAAAQESTRAFAEKQAYKRHYIAGLADQYKKETLTAKVDLEDKLYAEAVKAIWTGYADETAAAAAWLDEFLDAQGGELADAQDQVGDALADALAEQLDRLGEALGAIGDAFFQAKHDEVERLMNALYGYGYGDYKDNYTPTFKHEDEAMDGPYDDPAGPTHHAHHEDHVHDEESEEEEAVAIPEPAVSLAISVADSVEDAYVEPEPVVVYEPSEPTYVPSEPSEPTYVPPSEPTVYEEPEPESESESSYSRYSYSSRSSYSSHSHHGHHGPHRSYDHVKPYRPPAPTHTTAAAPQPAYVSPPVVDDGHSDGDSSCDVEINIYNGVGGNTVLGLGGSIECAPREGECRPQCPEV